MSCGTLLRSRRRRQQLQGVTVVCKHGGYIATIRDALNAQQREYKRVVIHVGTNDADLSIESLEVLEDFQLLIEDAVSITDEVVVSSLCPRLDDSRAKIMVDAVNAWLQGLVEGLGCIFVSHASNFYVRTRTSKVTYLTKMASN